jgi:prolyl-tRNA synthetase
MGCHGIGVSRMIGAVAEMLADEKGLMWPRVMAPFEVAIIADPPSEQTAHDIYDELAIPKSFNLPPRKVEPIDAILDDRHKSFAWKIKDADLVGYPIVVVLGRAWRVAQLVEVQCRRLGVTREVPLEKLRDYISGLLKRL